MDLFNIVCGVCSIAGLLVSIFTAVKVVNISNKNKNCTFNGSYTGGNINESTSGKRKQE